MNYAPSLMKAWKSGRRESQSDALLLRDPGQTGNFLDMLKTGICDLAPEATAAAFEAFPRHRRVAVSGVVSN